MAKNAERGKLFLPYKTLNGFEELVRQQTRQLDPRRARSDEENEALSRQVLSLQKGMRVRVTYYEDGYYRTCCGTVRQMEPVSRTLTLDTKTLPLDDVYAVEAVDLPGEEHSAPDVLQPEQRKTMQRTNR